MVVQSNMTNLDSLKNWYVPFLAISKEVYSGVGYETTGAFRLIVGPFNVILVDA